jgi:hypothetical protein
VHLRRQGKSASCILNTIEAAFKFITTAAPDAFADPSQIPTDYTIWRPVAAEVFVSDRLGLNWDDGKEGEGEGGRGGGGTGGGTGDVPLEPSVHQRVEAALQRDLAFFGALLRKLKDGALTPPQMG